MVHFLFISPLSNNQYRPLYCLFSKELEPFMQKLQTADTITYGRTGSFTVNLLNMTEHYLHSYIKSCKTLSMTRFFKGNIYEN